MPSRLYIADEIQSGQITREYAIPKEAGFRYGIQHVLISGIHEALDQGGFNVVDFHINRGPKQRGDYYAGSFSITGIPGRVDILPHGTNIAPAITRAIEETTYTPLCRVDYMVNSLGRVQLNVKPAKGYETNPTIASLGEHAIDILQNCDLESALAAQTRSSSDPLRVQLRAVLDSAFDEGLGIGKVWLRDKPSSYPNQYLFSVSTDQADPTGKSMSQVLQHNATASEDSSQLPLAEVIFSVQPDGTIETKGRVLSTVSQITDTKLIDSVEKAVSESLHKTVIQRLLN